MSFVCEIIKGEINIRINEIEKISHRKIKNIFYDLLELEVKDIKFMTDGGSTTNYKIVTSEGTYLLKLYPRHRENNSEMILMRDLEKEINVPKIHYYDCSRRIVSTDFLISDFIEGITFRQYVQKFGIRVEHASKIEETLSIIHNEKKNNCKRIGNFKRSSVNIGDLLLGTNNLQQINSVNLKAL